MTYYGGKEMADAFRTVRTNTLKIAEEVPEEKYSFKPANAEYRIAIESNPDDALAWRGLLDSARGDVDREGVVTPPVDPAGGRGRRDQVVHRVRRLEAHGGAARAAEGLQQLLEDLVAAVGGPQLLGRQRGQIVLNAVDCGHDAARPRPHVSTERRGVG